MRKLVQNLGAAKINMLEKIGKRDTTETVEMQTEIRVITTKISFIKDHRKWKRCVMV